MRGTPLKVLRIKCRDRMSHCTTFTFESFMAKMSGKISHSLLLPLKVLKLKGRDRIKPWPTFTFESVKAKISG